MLIEIYKGLKCGNTKQFQFTTMVLIILSIIKYRFATINIKTAYGPIKLTPPKLS